jgi:hypothetical protein
VVRFPAIFNVISRAVFTLDRPEGSLWNFESERCTLLLHEVNNGMSKFELFHFLIPFLLRNRLIEDMVLLPGQTMTTETVAASL